MDKVYEPGAIESRWYREWEQRGYFAPADTGTPYCIMIPPPNVTGTLHMGHAFQDTIMDALTRSPHARRCHAVAGGHRSCRHRHADGGRAAAECRGTVEAHRPGPRSLRETRVGMEGAVRRHDQQQLRRLGASVDWSRDASRWTSSCRRGHRSVRAAARRRTHLSRQAPGQLGSGAAHRAVGPRGALAPRKTVTCGTCATRSKTAAAIWSWPPRARDAAGRPPWPCIPRTSATGI
jgi:hypothetical protein